MKHLCIIINQALLNLKKEYQAVKKFDPVKAEKGGTKMPDIEHLGDVQSQSGNLKKGVIITHNN